MPQAFFQLGSLGFDFSRVSRNQSAYEKDYIQTLKQRLTPYPHTPFLIASGPFHLLAP